MTSLIQKSQTLSQAPGVLDTPVAIETGAEVRLWNRLSAWWIVATLTALVYLPSIGQRSLWFPDEPDIAEPTLSMLATGDWIVPHHNGAPWLDYPPLTYWLGAISSTLMGKPSPAALRLPVTLLAILLVVATAAFVERRFGRAAGLWSGVSLATAPQFVYQSVNFHPDMAFAVLISAGIGSYAHGALGRRGARSVGWIALGFALFGGAVLAKGPLGLLLPGLILLLWQVSRRNWRAVLWLAPLSVVSIAVALPWYLAVARATEGGLVWQEVYLQNFARFGAGDRGHYRPSWLYYVWGLAADWAPWSIFLPTALWVSWRRSRREPLLRLATIWFLTSLVFLSAAATKRQVYLLPAYPAIALLIGHYLATVGDGTKRAWPRRSVAAVGALGLSAGLGLPVLVFVVSKLYERLPQWERANRVVQDLAFPFAILCLGLAGGGIVIHRLAARDRAVRALAALGTLLFFVYATVFLVVFPRLDGEKSYRRAAVWLRQQSGDRPIGLYLPGAYTKVAGFRVEDPSYLRIHTLETPDDVARYLRLGRRLVVLDSGQVRDVAPTVVGWDELPRREFVLGSRTYLAVGPRGRVVDREGAGSPPAEAAIAPAQNRSLSPARVDQPVYSSQ